MGRIFLVELDGRAYRCRFCDSPLALADDIISRLPSRKGISVQHCGEHNAWSRGREANAFWFAYCRRYFLLLLRTDSWMEVIAHDRNQIYKEGKFVLERWRIDVDVAEEFNLDAPPGSSDTEIP